MGACKSDLIFHNGSGDNQVNNLFHVVDTMPSGGEVQYNLSSLTFTIFNDTYTVTYLGGVVKGLTIRNTETEAGRDIIVACTGVGAFNDPFDGHDGYYVLKPQGIFPVINSLDGFPISSGNSLFSLIDGGTGAGYEIAIIGTSGTM